MKLPTRPCPHCGGTGKTLDNISIGRTLAAVREEAKVSAIDVAALMDVHRSMISLMESGKRGWSKEKVDWYLEGVDKAKARMEAEKAEKEAKEKAQ